MLVVESCTCDHCRAMVLVEHVQSCLRVIDLNVECHQTVEPDSDPLGRRTEPLTAFVLHPHLDDSRLAAFATGGGIACVVVAPEVDLEVPVAHFLRLSELDYCAALEQHRPMTEAIQRTHVVGDEHDRLALVPHPVEDVEAFLLERGVTDRQHLVDQKDLGVHLDRDREREAHVHS